MEVDTLTTRDENTLLAGLRSALTDVEEAFLCVAFAQTAGVHLLRSQLEGVRSSKRLLVTTTFGQSSPEALHLAGRLGVSVSILNPAASTFHPKMYLARTGSAAVAVIGSPNLTGGLVSNVEAAVVLRGTVDDPPIHAAWAFAESLWGDPRRQAWAPQGVIPDPETFDPCTSRPTPARRKAIRRS
jgi:hypothetical protein